MGVISVTVVLGQRGVEGISNLAFLAPGSGAVRRFTQHE